MVSDKACAATLLRDVFGFDGFRLGQEEIVEAVIAGENTLDIMPTGGGKSLCFQLPALMREGVTVVISPLIALMKEHYKPQHNVIGERFKFNTRNQLPEELFVVFYADLRLLPQKCAFIMAIYILVRS